MRKNCHYLSVIGITLLVFLTTVNANAITTSISPDDAKYMGIDYNGAVNGPYSGSTLGPFVGKIDGMQSNVPSLNVESRGFYEFDINSILSSTVNSASFSFLANDPAEGISSCFDLSGCPPITAVDIYGYAGTGTVSVQNFDMGSFLATIDPLPTLGSLISIDVTSFIIGLVSDGSSFAGLSLWAGSSEGGLRVPNGLLTVDYSSEGPSPVPEPATFILFGSGLAGLAFYRRKRK